MVKEPVQTQEAGSRLPSVGHGRCHWSQATARCAQPTAPGDSARNTPPLRHSATPQPAPLHHASRGTPELVVRGRTPRHASCGGGNSNPHAATRGQDRAMPVIQEGPPERPRSAPRPPPQEVPSGCGADAAGCTSWNSPTLKGSLSDMLAAFPHGVVHAGERGRA